MKKRIFLALLMVPLLFTGNQIREIKAEGAPYQVTNGGFETGDLTGWKPYTIWKGETGVSSWTNITRVVSSTTTYFQSDGHKYNFDDNYGLGITWKPDGGGVDWSQLAERMGHLRSSDFTLGGSGWISFKLGGGNTNNLYAYVSIRRSVDNVEVARFGNPMRNKNAFATHIFGSTISNSEAFVFPYYFDLTEVADIGTELYITISETAGFEWTMLSADSFVTYYPEAPSIPAIPDPETNTTWTYMATNILPSIQGISTASNTITNGDFSSGLDGWDNVNSAWRIVGISAGSDINGSASMGILRSSAFTVTSNRYLRFGWGGAIRFDKQIFVSVREVGTNNEILRFVRRDNLSTKESDNADNHMLDLSSLNPNLKYYLEFCDNKSSSNGKTFVDTIRLVDLDEWNTVVATDRAVRIADLAFSAVASESFARYFLDITGPYCEVANSSAIPWNDFANLYAIQRDSTKNYFVGASADESLILDARARYLHILTVHPAFESNPFMKNSSGTPYSGSFDPVLPITVQDDTGSTAIFVIATLSITLLGATLYIYTRKQQRS